MRSPRRGTTRRSILFASVTAEEQGLLGSEYLGKHPPIPAGRITLDLNYDDILRWALRKTLKCRIGAHHLLPHSTGGGG